METNDPHQPTRLLTTKEAARFLRSMGKER